VKNGAIFVEIVHAKQYFFLVLSNHRIATPLILEAVAIVEELKIATLSFSRRYTGVF
jgi:hypothetical protein